MTNSKLVSCPLSLDLGDEQLSDHISTQVIDVERTRSTTEAGDGCASFSPNFSVSPHAFFFGSDTSGSSANGTEGEVSEFSEDSTFERVSINDEESDDFFFGMEAEQGEEEDEQTSADDDTNTIPFWFSQEDSGHVEVIMNKYTEELIDIKEFQRSNQPFVASVVRSKAYFACDPFQTFDTVYICNNQRMAPQQCMPSIRTVFLLSSWDTDGVPISFFKLSPCDVPSWIYRTEEQPKSYLYCQPDWYHRSEDGPATKFVFSSSDSFHPVTYANLPWENTPFHHCIRESSPSRDSLLEKPDLLFLCGNNRFSP